MKDSHMKTPRTMDECHFQSWGQAVFVTDHRTKLDRFTVYFCVTCIVLTFIIATLY